ncbi:MAG: SCP2 sterol-binding domain-containing protein [Lachnospiraceae bacterium]|nr:SCP2 sterol-binding domain-containing protein [Lachnospiraceae bacterium]
MKINIYYAGRGLIDDPTIYVINKLQEVLEELHVRVERYNLHEMKTNITTLPKTLKEADGAILATTVEWLNMNGWMQVFLDACWFYGDKDKISKIYMVPVVMSTTYGEREAQLSLINAWEMLGGKTCRGLCAYVEDPVAFELNEGYRLIIEKQAEDLYRSISQKMKVLPSSTIAIKQNILKETMDFTPQESEQLSRYAADDVYVKKQKEDIEELAGIYKNILENKKSDGGQPYLESFTKAFQGSKNLKAVYALGLEDKNRTILLECKNGKLNCQYTEEASQAEVSARLSSRVLEDIIAGKTTFQASFMKGDMAAKGDFALIRRMDEIFRFS